MVEFTEKILIDEFMNVNETESGRSINFVFEKLPTGTHKVFAQIS